MFCFRFDLKSVHYVVRFCVGFKCTSRDDALWTPRPLVNSSAVSGDAVSISARAAPSSSRHGRCWICTNRNAGRCQSGKVLAQSPLPAQSPRRTRLMTCWRRLRSRRRRRSHRSLLSPCLNTGAPSSVCGVMSRPPDKPRSRPVTTITTPRHVSPLTSCLAT